MPTTCAAASPLVGGDRTDDRERTRIVSGRIPYNLDIAVHMEHVCTARRMVELRGTYFSNSAHPKTQDISPAERLSQRSAGIVTPCYFSLTSLSLDGHMDRCALRSTIIPIQCCWLLQDGQGIPHPGISGIQHGRPCTGHWNRRGCG